MTIFACFLYSKEYKKTNLFINQNQQVMKKLLTIFMLCFAVFVANAQQVFLLQESFDDATLPSGWNVVDADGDGFNWTLTASQESLYNIHSGEGCIVSASYDFTEGALTPDNWLISPALTIPAGAQDVTLSWWVRGQDPDYAVEHYAVYVSTTGAAVSNFSNPAVYEGNSTGEYVNLTVDLTSFAGQTVYVGFRHYNVSDMFYLNLDDIEVSYSDPTLANAPANFTVTPDPNYGLSAELAWTNPATTVGGVALTAITSIELYRGTTLVNSFSNPTVGAAMTYTDNAIPAAGQYTYTVYAVTTAGNGLVATQTVMVGNVCPITLDLVDSYGDGWNGNAIEIYDANNTLIGSYTIASGASATEEVMLAPGTYTFVWVVGSYPSECSFSITNSFGIELFAGAGSSMSAGTFFTLNHSCDAPANAPTDFTATPDPNLGLSVDLSWTNPTTSYVGDALTSILSVELYRDATLVNSFANPAVGAAMTYTDNTITEEGLYTYTVYAVTEAGDGLTATQTVSVGNGCPVTLNMVDSYGDGWNGASIEIYDATNTLIGSYTVDVDEASEDIFLAPGTYTFVWVAGSYDSECSFTIVNSFGVTLYTGSSMSAGTFFTLNHNCDAPVFYSVSGTVTDGANNPIAGAVLTCSGFNVRTATTSATGAYIMDSVLSILPYNITVVADGFNGAATSFNSLNGDTTINFQLTAPQFGVTYAAPIEVTTTQGLNAQFTPVTVTNSGDGQLSWNTGIEYITGTRSASNAPMSYTFSQTRRLKDNSTRTTVRSAASSAIATAMPVNVDYSPMITTINGTPTRAAWDLLSSMEAPAAGQQGIATDGNFIYTCSWQATPTAGYTFIKYDLEGNMIDGFDIAGVTGCRDLTYDGTYFYVGTSSNTLYQLDLANQTLVSTINTEVSAIRHCSYDPQNDGFWVGNWDDLYLVDRTGSIVVTAPAVSNAYGSAYDGYSAGGPFLWLFTQASGNVGQCVFVQYDIAANALTNVTVDLSTIDSELSSEALAGGAFATDALVGGKFVLMANAQQQPNHISIVELAETGWLSVTPGSGHVAAGQTTDLTLNFNGENPLGDYYANLTITTSNPFVGDTVIPVVFHIIAPDCDAPTNLQVVPTDYTYMALTWTAPADVTGLVEYRIYKNGNTSNYFTSTTTSYNDTVTPGNYCYFVKALFNDGTSLCLSLASDTVCEEMLHAPSITVTPQSMNFTAPAGTASGAQTAAVLAYTLTTDITVTTNAPFEVSVDGTTYGPTATIAVTGNETNATLYVRMGASAEAGIHTDNVVLSSDGATATIALNGNAYECNTIATFPYTTDFTDEAKNNCWLIENSNNDAYTWEFSTSDGWATIRYNSSLAADDWLISPTFTLTGNEVASFDYWAGLGSYPESFEVYVIQGDERTNVVPSTTVSNTEAATQNINLNAYVGDYAIGIHCNSAADQYRLYVTNFSVTTGTGISDEVVENAVSIYPNPASTVLNVHAENYSNVQIINFLGQVVYSANITENDFQINVSNFSNGVYFIRLNGETTTTQKFIKK